MKKTILSTLAIALACSIGATTPLTPGKASKQFKPATKIQGAPNLAGLGTVKPLPQMQTKKANALARFTTGGYDPSAIKEIKYAKDQMNPIFINCSIVINTNAMTSSDEIKAAAIQFLEQNKPILHIGSPKDELTLKSFNKDEIGFTHVKFSQVYMGRPVMGKEMIVHFSPKGTTITGRWSVTPAVGAPSGLIGDQNAIGKAIASLTDGRGLKPMSAYELQLLKYNGPTSELVVYLKDNYNAKDRWAYKVTARTNFINMYECMVDAQTGTVIHSNDISCTTGAATTTLTDLNGASQSVNTYQHSNGTYYMIDVTRSMFNATQSAMPDNPVGAIWTVDAQGASASSIQIAQLTSNNNNTWPSSQTAASASVNGAAAYTYYKNTHNRNSIDGNGGTIISVINVTDDQGQPMDNAFWNGQLMAYGNGNVAFKPLAGGLDVAGHEMTHGVIQSTANLTYQDQSGALNESFADIFGSMIDKSNWTIGEQVVQTAYFPSGALRDLSNPHNGTTQGNNGWQPAIMSEYVTGTTDHGGVHTNSGINNHAFYYFATATSKQVAEKVYYRALTQYLTAVSQFLDARIAVAQAAADLYGNTEVQAVKSAYDQVEIYDGTNTQPTNNIPVAGADWIILQGTDMTAGSTALYMVDPSISNPQAADFHALNTLFGLNNVSVVDDGSIAYFVGTDNNVYSITTDYTNPVQTPITSTGDWQNVSVSRDGHKFALVSKYQDTAIYIYDGTSLVTFHLYNPTFSDSTTTNGPVYADALDWDPTGEFVIYDEKNVINNTGSTTEISYWDIGLIKAWDKTANTFGTGEISKLINNLPDGYSIGNPVFSKNEIDVVAFDVSNGTTGLYDVQGANLTTGAVGTMLVNSNVPCIPSYSGADDKITFTTTDSVGNAYVGIEPIASDFINGNGNPTYVTEYGQYSVWFTKGTRANAQCVGLSANITANGSTDYPITSVVLDAGAGYTSYAWNTGDHTQTITVTQAGNYVVTVTTSNGCTLVTNGLTIGYGVGVHDVAVNNVKVYPVPASDKVYIDLTNANDYTSIDMTDMTGRSVIAQTVNSKTIQLDLSGVESGIYMLHFKNSANSNQYTTRIIKE